MSVIKIRSVVRSFWLLLSLLGGFLGVFGVVSVTRYAAISVRAAPVPPPVGYPKLSMSTKVVSPTLAHTGGATLLYEIEILNTGAYTADGVTFADALPAHTTYNGDAHASSAPDPIFSAGVINWTGEVGFDSSVLISFSVNVSPTFSGVVQNHAIINHPLIARPVTVTAETVVTDLPILGVVKSSTPVKPGPGKPLTYILTVDNHGQPAVGLPITLVDRVPLNTALRSLGPDASASPAGDWVTWTRTADLATGASTIFTYSVDVNPVPSGTVISNVDYKVSSPQTGVVAGDLYTVTVINPILSISKSILPDPPGSNRPFSYTLTVLNMGSLATNLVVRDRLPAGVTYLSGGTFSNGEVSWSLPQLDTGEFARVSFTAYIPDIAYVHLLNSDYSVCSAENVCKAGQPLDSLIIGPVFEASATMDPVAKKPGGGTGPVTPTLRVENLGPGNALDATAYISFKRISVSLTDLVAVPPSGIFSSEPSCGENCVSYRWIGDLGVGEVISFTTLGGQSTIGGEEGTIYSATVQISDTLGVTSTQVVSATALGKVTHFANLIPTKSAPPAIGDGQVLTYTLKIYNSGLSTDTPPFPVVTDTVPVSTTLVHVSDGGLATVVGSRQVISWTLPAFSPGDSFYRSFSVRVGPGLISGTQIINKDYRTRWSEIGSTGFFSNTGTPVTTTVKEIGLIDSFKTVSPELVHPGPGNLLTYTVHVVNTSPMPLAGVTLDDLLPWQYSTYQRDAVASAGQLISDIVSLNWIGDVGAFSEEQITFTVLVDSDFMGPITNTAFISHSTLAAPVVVHAVAYVTDQPVLQISKTALPDPVQVGEELLYTIHVVNLGQQATSLIITDTLPANTTYVLGSATSSGQLTGDTLRWDLPVLPALDELTLMFRVKVMGGLQVVNDRYRVSSAEGVAATGAPVVTKIQIHNVFFPVIRR